VLEDFINSSVWDDSVMRAVLEAGPTKNTPALDPDNIPPVDLQGIRGAATNTAVAPPALLPRYA